MRNGMKLLLCAAVVAGCGSSSTSGEVFHANMSAAQEVTTPPPNVAGANPVGTAVFTNNGDGTVSYTVNASGLTTQFSGVTFTGMHIHLGASGASAGIAVPLTTPTAGATAGTTTVAGTFSASTITQAGVTLDQVLTAMRNGNAAYINIHTSRNPGGELRGQISSGGL